MHDKLACLLSTSLIRALIADRRHKNGNVRWWPQTTKQTQSGGTNLRNYDLLLVIWNGRYEDFRAEVED
jgi:hypothetical protein